ncbi:MAG: CBS domain-containing protein [Sulfolobaceae archaeon]
MSLKVYTFARKPVIVIRENEKIVTAAREMKNHNIGSLLVLDSQDKIVGIITERDIVRAFADERINAEVKEYMTRDVKGIRMNASIYSALKVMIENGFRHLPVLSDDNKKIYGIVSIRDLVRGLIDLDNVSEKEEEGLESQVCPVCGLEIDEYGYCGCGAGSD